MSFALLSRRRFFAQVRGERSDDHAAEIRVVINHAMPRAPPQLSGEFDCRSNGFRFLVSFHDRDVSTSMHFAYLCAYVALRASNRCSPFNEKRTERPPSGTRGSSWA